MTTIKKKKRGSKKGIQYYGKASDGYDPSTQDGNWDQTGSDDGGGSEISPLSKSSMGHQARSGSSKTAVTTKSKTPSKPKPKPGGGRRP